MGAPTGASGGHFAERKEIFRFAGCREQPFKAAERLRLREAPGNGKTENFSEANLGRQTHLSVLFVIHFSFVQLFVIDDF